MFVPDTFAAALLMMLASTLCWGSWANTYKLTRGYRFELFYWDYVLGTVLIATVLALTMGSLGSTGKGVLANVQSADPANLGYAVLAGAIFNVANLLLVAGIELAGLAIAFPVAIGTALVVGVTLSYLIQAAGDARMLALGVSLAVVAVVMDGKAYASLATAGRRASRTGLGVCLASGLLMGLFAPLVTKALTAGHPLGPYSIGVFFTLGAWLCCLPVNTYLMRRPIAGPPVSFGDYLAGRSVEHALGLAGGIIWGVGMVFNFVAANLVGVAIAYAIGQAAPMVAALWGVLVWREFQGATRRTRSYLALMFAAYVLAILVIARSYTT